MLAVSDLAPPKCEAVDLTGILQRGARFQVRIVSGIDPATGKQLNLTRSAATVAEASTCADVFREQTESYTDARRSGCEGLPIW